MTQESAPEKQPVGADHYDDKWIASAWGAHGNQKILDEHELCPRPRVSRAVELMDIRPGQRILDIACGRGEVPALAAARGAYAVGIDFSGASLRFAGQLKAALRTNNSGAGAMELIQADATCLPFADGIFDRISMLDIVEHLTPSQLAMMMREVGRMLAPGGFAVVHTLPNRWVYDITFPLLSKFSSRFPPDPRGPVDRVVHINEQDLIGLAHTLKSCGLRHRLWLEQQMPAQARWNASNDEYGDNRDAVYPMLLGATGRALELLSLTPFKLLLCNDIYGLLWRETAMPAGAKPRLAMTERLVAMFG